MAHLCIKIDYRDKDDKICVLFKGIFKLKAATGYDCQWVSAKAKTTNWSETPAHCGHVLPEVTMRQGPLARQVALINIILCLGINFGHFCCFYTLVY